MYHFVAVVLMVKNVTVTSTTIFDYYHYYYCY